MNIFNSHNLYETLIVKLVICFLILELETELLKALFFNSKISLKILEEV